MNWGKMVSEYLEYSQGKSLFFYVGLQKSIPMNRFSISSIPVERQFKNLDREIPLESPYPTTPMNSPTDETWKHRRGQFAVLRTGPDRAPATGLIGLRVSAMGSRGCIDVLSDY